MELMNKVMANISGVTLGALFFMVGELVFTDPSISWLRNLFVFVGLFILVVFLSNAFDQYVKAKDPNFDRVTEIAAHEEESKNASNAGKAKAFDLMIYIFAIMVIALSLLGASWQILSVVLLGYTIHSISALSFTYKEYKQMWSRRSDGFKRADRPW